MKKIKFNDIILTMPYDVVIQGATLRAEVMKEDYSLVDIAPIVDGVEEIQVLEDGEVTAIYNNFIDVVSLQIFPDYPVSGEAKGAVISITLANPEIQTQLDSINNTISDVQQTVADTKASTEAAIDNLSDKVDEITPYTETKKAYYGETEKTFYDVPNGNVSVFFDNYNGEYSIDRIENRLIVSFDALEEETNITISVQ